MIFASGNTQLSKRLARAEAELQALKMSQLRMESVAAAKTATQNACKLLSRMHASLLVTHSPNGKVVFSSERSGQSSWRREAFNNEETKSSWETTAEGES